MPENTLFEWRRQIASESGPSSSTTRHVLLTLSLHMNVNGGSCHPSIRLLVTETGLSNRTVMDHLDTAVQEGWIERSRRSEGRGWRGFEYTARIPDGGEGASTPQDHDVVKEPHHPSPRRGERGSPPQADNVVKEVQHPEPRRGEPDDSDVVNLTHHGGEGASPEDVRGRQGRTVTTPATTDPPNPPAEQRGADEPTFDPQGRPRQLLKQVCLLGDEEGTTSEGWTFGIGLLCTQWDWLVARAGGPLEPLMALSVVRDLAEAREIIEPEEPFSLTLLVAGMNVREGDASDDPEDWRFYQDCVHEAEKRQMIDHPLVAETAAGMRDVNELLEEAG